MFAHCYEDGRTRGQRLARVIGAVVGGVFLAVALALALGWLIQILWNATLAVIFGLATITYWQAVGLFILAKLFFSVGHHGYHHSRPKKFDDQRRHGAGADTEEEGGWAGHPAAFRQYWETEGRQAFENYLERRKKEDAR